MAAAINDRRTMLRRQAVALAGAHPLFKPAEQGEEAGFGRKALALRHPRLSAPAGSTPAAESSTTSGEMLL